MVTNHRRYRRMTLKTSVTTTGIVTPHGEQIRKSYQLQLEDISAGGVRFRVKFPIPVGTHLELVFQLADRKVSGTVEAVRVSRTEGGLYDVGCRFVSLNPVNQEDIIKFVTLSSVRDAQPSAFYSLRRSARSPNEPTGCRDCRCDDCAHKESCRACSRENCGKRFCRMFTERQKDIRPHS